MSDKPSLKEETLKISKEIKANLTVDASGECSGDSQSVYEAHLPDGITMDTVKSVSSYNTTFCAAGTHAVGELAIEAMKKDKKLESVTAKLPFGSRDSLNLTFHRSREGVQNFGADKGKSVTQYGSSVVRVRTRAGNNSGQMAAARKLISDLATEAFGK